jgi:hypothetical protein
MKQVHSEHPDINKSKCSLIFLRHGWSLGKPIFSWNNSTVVPGVVPGVVAGVVAGVAGVAPGSLVPGADEETSNVGDCSIEHAIIYFIINLKKTIFKLIDI